MRGRSTQTLEGLSFPSRYGELDEFRHGELDEFRHGELDEPWAKLFAMAFLTFRQAQGDGWLKVIIPSHLIEVIHALHTTG